MEGKENKEELSETEKKLAENEASKMVMEKFAQDDLEYNKSRTQFFFKLFWVIATIVNLYSIWHFAGWKSGFQAHFASFVLGVLALKIYNFIPKYMDYAEKMGLVQKVDDNSKE